MSAPRKGRTVTIGAMTAAVVACAACRAGPLLGIAASVGAASLVGSYWILALLILVAMALTATVILLVRRRRAWSCRVPQRQQVVQLRPTRPDPVSGG